MRIKNSKIRVKTQKIGYEDNQKYCCKLYKKYIQMICMHTGTCWGIELEENAEKN